MKKANQFIVLHKPPFTGWLIVILALFVSFYFLNKNDQKNWNPHKLTQIVEKDLEQKLSTLQKLNYNVTDSNLLQQTILSCNELKDVYVYVYQNGVIKYWSGNLLHSDELWSEIKLNKNKNIITNKNITVYYQKHTKYHYTDTFTIIELIPIQIKFTKESLHLKSKFYATSKIKSDTKVSPTAKNVNSYPVRYNNKPIFYLTYLDTKYFENSVTAKVVYYLALLLFTLYILTIISSFCRKVKYPVYLVVILGILKVIYSELYKHGIIIPEGFLYSDFHSPSLLGSSAGFHSFYHILSDTIFSTLILFYIIFQVSAKRFIFFSEKYQIANNVLLIIATVLLAYSSYYVTVQKIIVLLLDSKISFNVEKLKYINQFTFWGILVLILLIINFILILYFIYTVSQNIFKNKYLKPLMVILLYIVVMCLQYSKQTEFVFFSTLMLTFIVVWIIHKLGAPFGLDSKINTNKKYQHIWLVWFTLISLWTTFQTFAYSYFKEIEIRKFYAQQQGKKQDHILEYSFNIVKDKIKQDKLIKRYFKQSNTLSIDEIRVHTLNTYLTNNFPDYNIDVKLIGKNENNTTEQLHNPLNQNEIGLELDENITSEILYKAFIPIIDKGGIYITFTPRSDTDLPEIFRIEDNMKDFQFYDNYITAIFESGKFVVQKSPATLPHNLSDYKVNEKHPLYNNLTYSDYYFKHQDNIEVIVRYYRNEIVSFASLFSYSMLVFLCVWILIYIIRMYINIISKYQKFRFNINMSLRSKINSTIGITVFLAFLIISISTYYILGNRNQDNIRNKINDTITTVMHYTEANKLDVNNENAILKLSNSIRTLKTSFNINAYLYNKEGKLIVAANEKLLDENIIGNLINPVILRDLKDIKTENLLFTENINSLKVPVIYTALTDINNNILGFVGVPKFSTISEINNSFSDQLIVLINIYIIIFFIASIAAFIISNSIINSFNLLIQKFRDIRLKHNERIEWHHDDEIGILVTEYNLMLERVENLAQKLTISEREAIWREVAKQVAHEIKNPLTPIKLNVQYLQNAIQSGRDNIQELTLRISESIIEQIENLNVIASAFSNFAKMPKVNPEVLEVNTIIRSFVVLFENESHCEITFNTNQENIYILIDKNQLSSVFSNILKNAVQAIPKGNEGWINIYSIVDNNTLTISIKDNGVGIPEEVRGKLFAPYFTTKHEGNGIGLYLCRIFIEEANGEISFETKENVGTTFFIKLPVSTEEKNNDNA